MEHENLIAPLHESLDLWYEKSKQTFGLTNWKKPKLDIVSLKGTCGAKAFLRENTIKVNWTLYKQNQDDFLKQIVCHEISHLVDFQLNGRVVDGHGPKWQYVMRRLGLPATKCHSYDVTSVRGVNIVFEYKCPTCTKSYFVGSKDHYKVQGNKSIHFTCKRCKGNLISTGKTTRQ